MWNPFKKKLKYDYIVNDIKVQDNTQYPHFTIEKCIANDPDVDTVVGYKDLNGNFYDEREFALASNARILKARAVEALAKVIFKAFGYDESPSRADYPWGHPNQSRHSHDYMSTELARAIHDNPNLLKDYLNANY